jgi:hypothetical protein
MAVTSAFALGELEQVEEYPAVPRVASPSVRARSDTSTLENREVGPSADNPPSTLK